MFLNGLYVLDVLDVLDDLDVLIIQDVLDVLEYKTSRTRSSKIEMFLMFWIFYLFVVSWIFWIFLPVIPLKSELQASLEEKKAWTSCSVSDRVKVGGVCRCFGMIKGGFAQVFYHVMKLHVDVYVSLSPSWDIGDRESRRGLPLSLCLSLTLRHEGRPGVIKSSRDTFTSLETCGNLLPPHRLPVERRQMAERLLRQQEGGGRLLRRQSLVFISSSLHPSI